MTDGTFSEETLELAHNGRLGMKWGRGKYSETDHAATGGNAKKTYTYKQKAVGAAIAGTAFLAAQAGIGYLSRHPEVLQRAANTIHGTKALTTGYKVVKLSASAVRVSNLGIGG